MVADVAELVGVNVGVDDKLNGDGVDDGLDGKLAVVGDHDKLL